ncbi:enolase C-terminal domain-like protein [Planctomycetota bacterium]
MKTQIPRRDLLASLAALSVGGGLSVQAAPAKMKNSQLTVTDLQMIQLTGESKQRSLYIKLLTDAGIEGLYGPIDEEAAMMMDRFFRKRLIGQDAFASETYWDTMYKASRHSRGSHYLMGLSTVDNALWDLKGKALGLPVYKLLGGSRSQVPAYASCLGFSSNPDALQAKAKEVKAEGYRHQKWFLRGASNSRRDAETLTTDAKMVQLLREAVGDDVDLMFDASRRWDLQYTIAWAQRVEQYRPLWIEEPLDSAQIDALAELSRETSIPVAMGEHFYGRWDAHNYLKEDVIRVVQADPEWCGGVSELVKMCTLASVYGAHVIPHGHSLHAALHVVASQPLEVCPLGEYLINKMTGNYYYFEKEVPHPINGVFHLSDRPGFGILLDETKIVNQRQVHWERV